MILENLIHLTSFAFLGGRGICKYHLQGQFKSVMGPWQLKAAFCYPLLLRKILLYLTVPLNIVSYIFQLLYSISIAIMGK